MISEVAEPVDVVHVDRPQGQLDHGRVAGKLDEGCQLGAFGQGEAAEVGVPGDVVSEWAGWEIGQIVAVERVGQRVDQVDDDAAE
ncbi:MAG: hypothetical protein ABW122_00700, partial [Ilumatobacteraceae bacterium]